jgi:hypothetical protein
MARRLFPLPAALSHNDWLPAARAWSVMFTGLPSLVPCAYFARKADLVQLLISLRSCWASMARSQSIGARHFGANETHHAILQGKDKSNWMLIDPTCQSMVRLYTKPPNLSYFPALSLLQYTFIGIGVQQEGVCAVGTAVEQ